MINKMGNQRYASHSQVPRSKQTEVARTSHAAAILMHKESQIDLVKKRISALCVREQKYVHRTINT
jgi:hypothetical protein